VTEIVQLQFESGTVAHDAVHRATVALLEAELEVGGLARQPQIHEQLVDSCLADEKSRAAGFAVGSVQKTDVLIARVGRATRRPALLVTSAEFSDTTVAERPDPLNREAQD